MSAGGEERILRLEQTDYLTVVDFNRAPESACSH